MESRAQVPGTIRFASHRAWRPAGSSHGRHSARAARKCDRICGRQQPARPCAADGGDHLRHSGNRFAPNRDRYAAGGNQSGSWAGLTRNEVEARWPGTLDGAGRYDWYFRSPDGETLDDLTARVRRFLADTARRDRVIAVSHGVTSRLIRGLFGGIAVSDALTLHVSRDVVFRLHDGSVDRINCDYSGAD